MNDEYVRRIPAFEDWTFLSSTSSIAALLPYTVGNATINTQATAVTFSSDVSLTADFTGRKIKFNENPHVYDFTFSNTTGGTISPPLSASNNVSAGAYTIFQPAYALSPDFDRFPKNGGLLLYQGGRIKQIREAQSTKEYYEKYNPSPSVPEICRVITFGTAGVPHVELVPPSKEASVFQCDYIRRLAPLRETTAGFVTIDAGSTTVTGSAGTTRFTEAQTGWYIRIDAFGVGDDSEWYRVANVAHNSSLTLSVAFGLSGATTAGYTLSAAPQMPFGIHNAILYGAAMSLMTDQNDPQYAVMASMKTAVLIDARRLYKTRVYSQEIETVAEEFHYRR